jgi:hypothetical protein
MTVRFASKPSFRGEAPENLRLLVGDFRVAIASAYPSKTKQGCCAPREPRDGSRESAT